AGLDLPADRRGVGFVFQDYALFPHMTVAVNTAFGLHHWRKAEREARVRELLSWVRMEALAERYPHELSGGQQQRVALARALAPRPTVVLLDEPFSNLDQSLRSELREEMRALIKQSGATALFVTHDREEAISLADKLIVMHEGRVIQSGAPHQLYWQPENLAVATLLGEANVLEGMAVNGYAECILGRVPLARSTQGRVHLVLRPEAVQVTPDAHGEVVVERVTYFGHDQLLTLRLANDAMLLARVSGVQRFAPGQRARAAVIAPAAAIRADE
ncbi:MAG: ABC transporter ATP-binding protein, partial [Thermoflexales bacterium]|nr:ABC transporter ATP-binding protein [Thermoflexales bacterium]